MLQYRLTHTFHCLSFSSQTATVIYHLIIYRVILSVLDPQKCEYLKDYSLDFEHAYMITYLYLAS